LVNIILDYYKRIETSTVKIEKYGGMVGFR